MTSRYLSHHCYLKQQNLIDFEDQNIHEAMKCTVLEGTLKVFIEHEVCWEMNIQGQINQRINEHI